MTSKYKVLDFVVAHLSDLEGDWTEGLEDMNVWGDISNLWDKHPGHANVIFAFIVMAYCNKSPWLEPHKDRYDNKIKIITRLRGPAAMASDIFKEVVYNCDDQSNRVIKWYVNHQKDSRWTTIVANKEFISYASAIAMAGTSDPKIAKEIGQMQREARELEKINRQIQDEISTEMLNLDKALQDESKPKATDLDDYNFMNHDAYIIEKRLKEFKDQTGIDFKEISRNAEEPTKITVNTDLNKMKPKKESKKAAAKSKTVLEEKP